MPYENEHACRLQPPNFKKYARTNCAQKHKGKCIDVIYGIAEAGKSVIQALRYPKKIWTAEQARAHCASRGGKFEAAAPSNQKKFSTYTLQVYDYSIRMENYMSKRYFVVPATMMVEGVHNGSAGPLLHLANEFSRYYVSWNDRPVVVEHPQIDGQFVSAVDNPRLTEKILVGRLQNTKVEEGELKSEAWIEEDRIKQISPLAFAYLMQKRPLQVSIGAFTDQERKEGKWNDEKYYAIARNYRPDHLALLPDGEGACSWTDGCGIR